MRKRGEPMRERTWLSAAMHAGFFLLLTASAARLVARHGLHGETGVALLLAAVLGALLVAIPASWRIIQLRTAARRQRRAAAK